jgi:hypothetical protein
MGFAVEGDGLVAGVVAGHVALAAVDAHVFVNERNLLLLVVEVSVRADHGERPADQILEG